jgi:hypothetical protein
MTLFVLMALAGFAGCSAETMQEAEEAAQETGQAIESGVEDAAEVTKETAQDVENALDPDDADNP